MKVRTLILFLSVGVLSVPSHVGCDLKIMTRKHHGENIMTTKEQIMGRYPRDNKLVLSITPQVCVDDVIDLQLRNIFKKKGILNVTGGYIRINNKDTGDDDCYGKMMRFENYASGVQWTAPTQPGSITFWGATAAGYGWIERGSQTVEVIGYNTGNSLCQGCPSFDNYKDLGNGFLLCWSVYETKTRMQLSYSKAVSNCWLGLGIGSGMIGSNVVIGSENFAKPFYIECKSLNCLKLANNLVFSGLEYSHMGDNAIISFSIPNSKLNINENIIFAYGTKSSSEGDDLTFFNKHSKTGSALINFAIEVSSKTSTRMSTAQIILLTSLLIVVAIVISILCVLICNLKKNHDNQYYKIKMELGNKSTNTTTNMVSSTENGKIWL